MDNRLVAVIGLVAVLAAAFFILLSIGPVAPEQEKEITTEEFKEKISALQEISIVMYVGTDYGENQAVITCATGLAESLSGIGKTVSNYAFEADYCIHSNLTNVSRETCRLDITRTYSLHIRPGANSSKFFENHADLYVEKGSGECGITAKQG